MTLADLREQVAEHVAEENDLRQRLESQFRMAASGKKWLEGIFPHQWQGACFGTVAERWLLCDEPGAGKTRQAVAWWDLSGAQKIIVMCEANLASQFAGEVMDLADHRTIVNLTRRSQQERHALIAKVLRLDEAVVFVNYEMFRRDEKALGKLILWQADTIVIDEAHNLKNVRTSNFKHAQRLVLSDNSCANCGALVYGLSKPCGVCGWKKEPGDAQSLDDVIATKSVKRVLCMTGTPMLNTPLDLFSLLHLVDPFTFRSLTRFKNNYLIINYATKKHEFKSNGVENLKPYIEDRYLGRTLEDVGIHLPKQRIHIERVELDPEKYPLQHRTVQQISNFYQIRLSTGETMTLMHLISVILRKRQANVWPGGIEIRDTDKDSPTYGEVLFSVGKEVRESAKMDACMERILELHKQGKRQIVFSQFRMALEEFKSRLEAKGLRVALFVGTTPDKEREEIRTNFYGAKGEKAKWDVVLVHYRTGGSGLNLTAAPVTHILDEEWNAGKRDQAYARNHRMGQTEETDVYVYRIPNTVDTWMSNLIDKKERMMKRLGQAMSKERMLREIREAIEKGEM